MKHRLCGVCLNFTQPGEPRCPFCGAVLPKGSRWAGAGRLGAVAVLGVGLALAGCDDDTTSPGDAGAGGQMTGGTGGDGGNGGGAGGATPVYGTPPPDAGPVGGTTPPDFGMGGVAPAYGPPPDFGTGGTGGTATPDTGTGGTVTMDAGTGGTVTADAGVGGGVVAYGPPPAFDAAVDAAIDAGPAPDEGMVVPLYGPPPPNR
jgi:hypothetical protein